MHLSFVAVISLLVAVWFFHSAPLNASVLPQRVEASTNSQRLALLTPNYSVDIVGSLGSTAASSRADNKLALLSPQTSIMATASLMPNVEVNKDGIITYVVQEGDTLSQIAETFDVSMNTIKWENGMAKDTIHPGKSLDILPVTGIRHTIQKGDTFAYIAKKYDVETEDITVFNHIDATKLIPGNKIMIPNGVKPAVVAKTRSTSSGSKAAPASSSASNGYYDRPSDLPITSTFGPRWGRYHYGIDFGGKEGSPTYATAAGTVAKIGCGSGYGKCLIIQHDNGTQSLYAHSSKILVSAGQKVSQGQKIAEVGSTGNVTGAHLHFEIINSSGSKKNVNFLK